MMFIIMQNIIKKKKTKLDRRRNLKFLSTKKVSDRNFIIMTKQTVRLTNCKNYVQNISFLINITNLKPKKQTKQESTYTKTKFSRREEGKKCAIYK